MRTSKKRADTSGGRTNAPSPAPRRDRRETEAKLFAAGVQVMSSLGYEGATTKRIAEVAGVNEQLISRYFGGKEGLLVAIMEDYKTSELVREHAARPEVAATVREEILGFLAEADFSPDREPFARLALGRAVVDNKVAQAINNLCTACYRPLLVERLNVHRARGAIDASADLDTVIDALIQVRLGLAAYGRMLFHLGTPRLKELCDTYAEVFARTLAGPDEAKTRSGSPLPAKGAATARRPQRR